MTDDERQVIREVLNMRIYQPNLHVSENPVGSVTPVGEITRCLRAMSEGRPLPKREWAGDGTSWARALPLQEAAEDKSE